MIRQPHTEARESIVAHAVKDVAAELRLVELADYVAFIRMEHFANIADIVMSAAELYFHPGTLAFGHGGEAGVEWSGEARVALDMQIRAEGATVYFTLILGATHADVDVTYVSFDRPSPDPAENTRFLKQALDRARLRPAVPDFRGLAGMSAAAS